MKDMVIRLKEQHENPFNHGWLAAHFGWDRDPDKGGIERGFNEGELSDNQLAIHRTAWLDGYDMAIGTMFELRSIALSKMATLEFD